MDLDVEGLIRRLILASAPLFTAGCWGMSSCPDTPKAEERTAEIERPDDDADGGRTTVTLDAYLACVDRLDCHALCTQYFSFAAVQSCERVPTDGFASGEERVAIHAEIIPICEGRRLEGYALPSTPERPGNAIGGYLARAAYLEGVSVPAFLRLGAELQAHGAPRPLVAAAARAARDEVRHHRMVTKLARRFGAEPSPLPSDVPMHVRSLEAVVAENAVEGCLRETVGALVAHGQALHAQDPAIRAVSRSVARDEARHAQLAFQVDRWARGRLSAATRERVEATVCQAAAELLREAGDGSSPEVSRAIGLPSSATLGALVIGTRDEWLRTQTS